MIFTSQSSSKGRLRGRGGSARSRLANTLTNRTMFGPEGCCENGSFDACHGESVSPRRPDKARISFAGQIIISHLNGNFFAIAARRALSLTFSRATNVPTAPMLTISNLDNSFAISAGWHRLAPPTFTARRNTTQGTRRK